MASPFESPTHRQKRITFELSVFLFYVLDDKAEASLHGSSGWCLMRASPHAPNHLSLAFGNAALSSSPSITLRTALLTKEGLSR